MTARAMSLAAALHVSCPRCGRNSFNRCVARGEVERGPHAARKGLALKTRCRTQQRMWCDCGGQHFADCTYPIGHLGAHGFAVPVCRLPGAGAGTTVAERDP